MTATASDPVTEDAPQVDAPEAQPEQPVEKEVDPQVKAQIDSLALVPTQKEFTPEQKAVLREGGIRNIDEINPAMLQGFLLLCLYRGVNPFIGEATIMPTEDGWAAILGIDGFRVIAERTGEFLGMTEPEWSGDLGEWRNVWPKAWGRPQAARIGVKRLRPTGVEISYGVVHTEEYEVYEWVPVDPSNPRGPKKRQLTQRWEDGRQVKTLLIKCLPGTARLETDRGSLRIAEIVKKRLPVKVRSFDVETGREVWAPVVNWWTNAPTDRWVLLGVPTGERGGGPLRMTEDHPVWTPDGWRKAGEIAVGDKVGVVSPTMTAEQHQIILGGLLGDGHLYVNPRGTCLPMYTESHSLKQEAYSQWKARALANLGTSVRHVETGDGTGARHATVALRTRALPALSPYAELAPADRLSDLSDLGLAVWLMDDARITRAKWNGTAVGRPYIELFCCGFGAEFADRAAEWFTERYGVTPTVARREKNPYLRFSADATAVILAAVAPYVRYDEDTNGKRWVAADIVPGPSDGALFVPVTSAEVVVRDRRETRYDIEVEGTHAFVYRNVILHNCAKAAGFRDAFPRELDGFYAPEEMERLRRERREAQMEREAAVAREARRAAYEEAQRQAAGEQTPSEPERHEVVEGVQEGVVVNRGSDAMDAVSRLRRSAQAAAPEGETAPVEEVPAPSTPEPAAEVPADLPLTEEQRVECLRAELAEQAAIMGVPVDVVVKPFAALYEGEPLSTWDSGVLLSIVAWWRPRVAKRLRALSRYEEARAYDEAGTEYVDQPDVLFGRSVQPVGDGS